MKKTFIIGSSGFVAKRHMDCLYALKQKPGVAANEIVLRPTAQDF